MSDQDPQEFYGSLAEQKLLEKIDFLKAGLREIANYPITVKVGNDEAFNMASIARTILKEAFSTREHKQNVLETSTRDQKTQERDA